jgi:hypothetical protein
MIGLPISFPGMLFGERSFPPLSKMNPYRVRFLREMLLEGAGTMHCISFWQDISYCTDDALTMINCGSRDGSLPRLPPTF